MKFLDTEKISYTEQFKLLVKKLQQRSEEHEQERKSINNFVHTIKQELKELQQTKVDRQIQKDFKYKLEGEDLLFDKLVKTKQALLTPILD